MTSIAIIDCIGIKDYAFESLADGPSALERVSAAIRAMPEISSAILVTNRDLPEVGLPIERVEKTGAWTLLNVLKTLHERSGEDVTGFLRVRGDAPLFDPALASRMIAEFYRYRPEYYFADGYPVGVASEILSPRALPALLALASERDDPIGDDGFFSVLQKDINSFDLETDISRVDLREYRLSLTCDKRRNKIVCEKLLMLGARDAESIQNIVPANLGILRTLPAFVSVQVTGGCPQACSYCPYPRFGGDVRSRRDFLDLGRFADMMDQVSAYCEDAVVDLSLWGEPSLYPDFSALAKSVLRHSGLSLIVETSGIGWQDEVLEKTASIADGRMDWIVSLDEPDPEAYARLRGEGYAEATARAEFLLRLFPGRVHVQAVRMNENEERLETFYRGWKAKTENVIIQKYDSFCGFLPNRAVADLSPLNRGPCWHLARDLNVLIDGSVPLCREYWKQDDAEEAPILGNVFDEGVKTVWERGEPWFRRHLERRYPAICGRCDEYHTYNA